MFDGEGRVFDIRFLDDSYGKGRHLEYSGPGSALYDCGSTARFIDTAGSAGEIKDGEIDSGEAFRRHVERQSRVDRGDGVERRQSHPQELIEALQHELAAAGSYPARAHAVSDGGDIG